nr:hypothetical protein [Tanacetum cinerariifolium]
MRLQVSVAADQSDGDTWHWQRRLYEVPEDA